MNAHDPLCPATVWPHIDDDGAWIEPPCRCDLIARARANEREYLLGRTYVDRADLRAQVESLPLNAPAMSEAETTAYLMAVSDVLRLLGQP